jgi:hypothetical protein
MYLLYRGEVHQICWRWNVARQTRGQTREQTEMFAELGLQRKIKPAFSSSGFLTLVWSYTELHCHNLYFRLEMHLLRSEYGNENWFGRLERTYYVVFVHVDNGSRS